VGLLGFVPCGFGGSVQREIWLETHASLVGRGAGGQGMGFGWVRLAWVWWVCPTRDPAGKPRGFGVSGGRWSGYGFGSMVGICRRTDLSVFGSVASFSHVGFRQCQELAGGRDLDWGLSLWSGSGSGASFSRQIFSLFLSPEFLGKPT
jgi:hypothetical protein